jgi:tetratricopeptide (TPR) repeat protein
VRTLLIATMLAALSLPARAETTADALARGRSLEQAFDFEQAYGVYRAAAAKDTATYDLWVRLARVAGDRGQRLQLDGKKAEAESAFAEAVAAARRAVRIDAKGWEGHSGLAANLGRLALFEGGKKKIEMSREVKAEADKALALNPSDDRSMHVLARWNRGLAELNVFEKTAAKVVYGGLPEGATMNNAVPWFEKAIAVDPDYLNHRLELGRTYLDLKLPDKAREQLELALKCPKKSPFDDEYRADAQVLLRKAHT